MLFCLYFIMKLYTISPNILYTILPVHTLAVARFFQLPALSSIWAVGDAGPYDQDGKMAVRM